MLLDGKKIAGEIYETLSQSIITLHSKPCLGAVLVGENAASMRYIRQKQKFAKEIGMDFQLFQFETTITEKKLGEEIQKLNLNENISGYIVQLPLPQHISPTVIISIINPKKDVDGFHPENLGKIMIGDPSGLAPCTPAGIMKIFEYYDISLAGKHIVILGRSNIVGKPLALMCINAGATVSSCNSKTPHISTFTLIADIVVCATGQKHILTSRMIGNDCIVIDVGFSIENENIYGDADFEAISANGNDITPVPGGVGPMTVAMLLSNTVAAHERNTKK